MKKLKVKANPEYKVIQDTGKSGFQAKFVGWYYDQQKQAFLVCSEPVEVDSTLELIRAIQSGALEAADKATAEFCGVDFQSAQPKNKQQG